MRGANLVTEALASAGVTTIFSLSGNQIMPVYDACLDTGLRIIHTRHEAAAVFMADAHAQLTGTLGVCMVTAAPGAANALGPLFSARLSDSPVLFLTGDSPVAQDGRGAFQELDQVGDDVLSRRPSSTQGLCGGPSHDRIWVLQELGQIGGRVLGGGTEFAQGMSGVPSHARVLVMEQGHEQELLAD